MNYEKWDEVAVFKVLKLWFAVCWKKEVTGIVK